MASSRHDHCSLSLRAQRSNLDQVGHYDRDCRVASFLTPNPVRSWCHFHRHGRDKPDKPGHDGNGWFHSERVGWKAGV